MLDDLVTVAAMLVLAAFAVGVVFFAKSLKRIEDAAARMEAAAAVVADNLASSVSRANATHGPEGAAADAALRTGPPAVDPEAVDGAWVSPHRISRTD